VTKQLDLVSVFQTANNAAFHVEVDGVSRLISDVLPDGTPVLVAYLAQWANRMVFPICWHDPTIPPPKYSRAASCFALKFREKLIGVTAAHVVKGFLEEKQKIPALTCQLRHLGDFDLEGALIDCDTEIDLATFDLTEAQLVEIRSPAFNCQNIWPPPEPQIGWAGAFAGFAEYLFRPDENFRVNADCLAGGVSQIEVGRSEIRMTYEPQTAKTIGNIPMIPPGTSLSGCSGGPLVIAVLEIMDGMPRPVSFTVFGAIIGSTNQQGSEGESTEYVSVVARRLECIQTDGKLARPNDSQWLPSR
jgi:hypothetical protein